MVNLPRSYTKDYTRNTSIFISMIEVEIIVMEDHIRIIKYYGAQDAIKKMTSPDFIKNVNIQSKMKIKCGNKTCTGPVTIKPTKDENRDIEHSQQDSI
jgi:hypothetical protein